ncbi:LacI family DNA-binding transcriptional regulator [Hoeflea sp.]|uniref:LacI family DNA-binding transcriptional regulator n=1 Tax=Hoeflea sp. TaxID=1940281 RepID=UPI003A8DE74C
MARNTGNSGTLAGGPLTMRDVARVAGVGVGTVSRVVNNADGVSAKTKEKVKSAIAQLGFNPNPIARSMRSGLTMSFACVVRDFSVPILTSFANAIQNAVDGRGFGLQFVSSYHDVERELDILNRLSNHRADGVVVATASETSPELLAALESFPVPLVLLDRDIPESIDAVKIDHRSGTRSAVNHLIQLGHRRIAIITGPKDIRPVRERIAGYMLAHEKFGVPVDESLIHCGSFGIDFAYSEAMQILASASRPTAVIAGGTAMLSGLLRAARDLGLKIPDDLSVVSGADNELAALHSPAITAVRWQHDQLGAIAGRFLLNRLETPNMERQCMVVPTELISRESCGPAPA